MAKIYTVWQQATREAYVLAESRDEAETIAEERQLFYDIDWQEWANGVGTTVASDLSEEYDLVWVEGEGWMSPSEVATRIAD